MKDKSEKESAKLFSVPDFVGDACKAIASRIRGAVAGVQFDDFHKVGITDCSDQFSSDRRQYRCPLSTVLWSLLT